MRILVDCCNYFLDNNNNGDRAVYQVLEMRLRRFWPDAEISWITLDPRLIQQTIFKNQKKLAAKLLGAILF